MSHWCLVVCPCYTCCGTSVWISLSFCAGFGFYAGDIMGTVLSISPTSGREPPLDRMDETKARSLMKPRTIVSTLTFKLVKQKNVVKVNPHPHQTGQIREQCVSRSETAVTGPSQKRNEASTANEKQKDPEIQEMVQASTGELLLCLGRFMRRRCLRVEALSPNEVISWFRNVDRTLLQQGWQEQGFITPPTLVFVYLLCRETISEDIRSPDDLHGIFLTCLYLTYSYLGNEISYPLKPFIVDGNKDVFWKQALDVIEKLSSEMLRINKDPQFFTQVFGELKKEGEVKREVNEPDR